MHVHRIYSRIDGVFVPTGHEVTSTDESPIMALIVACDDLARSASKASGEQAFAYKVDNRVEYFVSSAFFKWPNYPDAEEQKQERVARGAKKARTDDARK